MRLMQNGSLAKNRRVCSMNYQNLDLQFHIDGSQSFGAAGPAFRMGCGFEDMGPSYKG